MPLPAEIRPKLAKLFPMLSSDKAFEVAATAAAIGRTLQAAGADWHDLSQIIDGNSEPEPSKPVKHSARMLFPKLMYLTRDAQLAWMTAIAAQPWATEWESAFCGDIARQIYTQPHRGFSPKQVKAIDGLLRRAFCEGVRA